MAIKLLKNDPEVLSPEDERLALRQWLEQMEHITSTDRCESTVEAKQWGIAS
jgi:hypothetical protein